MSAEFDSYFKHRFMSARRDEQGNITSEEDAALIIEAAADKLTTAIERLVAAMEGANARKED